MNGWMYVTVKSASGKILGPLEFTAETFFNEADKFSAYWNFIIVDFTFEQIRRDENR